MNLFAKSLVALGGMIQRTGVSLAGAAWLRGDDVGGGTMGGITAPYQQSAWVRGCVRKIAGPISSVDIQFFSVEGEGDDPIKIPVMEQFLREPMKGLGYADFVEATIGWRKMAGEAFWLLPDSALVPSKNAEDFRVIVARPDRMRHVVNAGVLEGWVFRDGAGRAFALLPEQVIHLKQWNPYDDFRGLSDYEAAMIASDADYLAAKFARNLMANNGDTGAYIVAKNGIPDDAQRQQILMDLRAKRLAQQRGEYRPVFLGGDITIEDPKIRSVDAAFLATRIENRHEIAFAFGVPMSMVDLKASYSIGSASDEYQLIIHTCVPEADKICDGLEQVCKKMTGQIVKASANWDRHPVFQEVRKERLASVDTLWSKGVPMSVVDDYLGLGLPDYEGKDIGFLPFSVAPIGAPLPEKDPALDEPDVVQDAVRRMLSTAQRRRADEVPECECCGGSIEARDADPDRDPAEVSQWRALIAKRQAVVRMFSSKFDRVLMGARAEVLRKIEMKAAKGVTKAAAADFIFDLGKFRDALWSSMRAVSATALQTAGDQLYKELGKDDPWAMPAPKATAFFDSRENRIADCAQDVFDQVMGSLQEGVTEGEPAADLARRVRAEFNGITKERSMRVALTETTAAFGTARQEAMTQAGVQWKRWLTSGNSNVRAAHRAMNGAIVPIGESFTVIDPKTGEADTVRYPGDVDGAGWNIINCHCVSVASAKGPKD